MKTGATLEFNFDGLIGPTHNYGGLAHGNLASQQNRRLVSRPKIAAMQGLEKMKFLMDLGVPQVVLPPQERPDMRALHRLGFRGSDAEILEKAARSAPELLAACSSASSMWAANAATVSPSADTADGLLHITPANLISHLHRTLETPRTAEMLRTILPGPLFVHHAPLPPAPETADEGAANHSRFCVDHGAPGGGGVELFTYGHDAALPIKRAGRFNPRQTRAASEAIARLHALPPERIVLARQDPAAIDAGAFHQDVLAVGHRHLFFCHERAFADGPGLVANLRHAFDRATGGGTPFITVIVPEQVLPLEEAIRSYLFNSQLVSLNDGSIVMLAPTECAALPEARAAIDLLRRQAPIREVYFADVRQSMRNGGGPACLRLRVVLTGPQQAALHPGVRLTPALYQRLRSWIEAHYRDELAPHDLADPHLLAESTTALAELHVLLNLSIAST